MPIIYKKVKKVSFSLRTGNTHASNLSLELCPWARLVPCVHLAFEEINGPQPKTRLGGFLLWLHARTDFNFFKCRKQRHHDVRCSTDNDITLSMLNGWIPLPHCGLHDSNWWSSSSTMSLNVGLWDASFLQQLRISSAKPTGQSSGMDGLFPSRTKVMIEVRDGNSSYGCFREAISHRTMPKLTKETQTEPEQRHTRGSLILFHWTRQLGKS